MPENEMGEARDVFGYLYSLLHSPSYREQYDAKLRTDFPRLPLTSSMELFRALAKIGGELVALHLMESSKLDKHITKFIGKGDNEVVKVRYDDETVWINGKQGFKGVPEGVWNFHIGGYQVCEKWLKDRKRRYLSEDDITHYHKIVVAINETIRLMAEIDKVIETYGGWPDAFTTSKT
jgi:predicted helicase